MSQRRQTLVFTLLFFLLASATAFGQSRGTIKGKVYTSDNKPADNVSVNLKGTRYGTITNENGEYTFKAPAASYTLSVSAIGLLPAEKDVAVVAGKSVTVDFMLQQNAQQLTEVAIKAKTKKYKVDNPSPTLRLNEPLLEVPQNIQVVTADQLKDQVVFTMLEGASRNVSGLTMQEHWGNYARINARGDRLAPFRNGMNIEATWGPLNEDMSFVDRIEFVKGPAGFMLANGNPSGFYNVVTKKPTGVNRQSFDFTAGSFNTYRATADFDGNITSNGKLQYRLNLMGQLTESWRPYDFTNRMAIAPVLRYKFSDKTMLTAEYTYQRQRMNAFGTAYLFSTNGYESLSRNFTLAPENSPASDIYDHSAFLNFEHKFNDKWKFTAQAAYFNYKQNAYSYWINYIQNNGDLDRSLGLWDASNRNKFAQAFVNGEVKTGTVVHRILGGLDFGDKFYVADYFQSGSLDPVTPFNINHPNNGTVAMPTFDRTKPLSERGAGATSMQHYQSVYVQDELGFLNQKLRLTLAGRFTHVTAVEAGANDRKITPRVGISYSVNDATAVYGVYDQAFLPQTGNLVGGGSPDPITGNNLEGGIKRDWFNGKWSTSVSVYQITKNNQLVGDPNNPTSGLVVQLGQTKTHGVEFDARGEIVSGLSLMANYAYTNSEISKDTDPANVGTPVPGFAKHVTNAWLSYRVQTGSLKGLGLSAGYQWQLNRIPWSLGAGTADLPNYFRLDAAASYQIKKLSFAVNVNNILNTYLYSGGSENYLSPTGSRVYTWQAEAPAVVRASIGYRF
ncbi:TonB-dependent receptor [Mucilaginibacter sp. PAMB04168]|uniref:TonB-dependent receptor n=1 Tax=Mucilaginibacter sp. PAMB04168 TaxID=3138567 RepID=UPI0031F633A5